MLWKIQGRGCIYQNTGPWLYLSKQREIFSKYSSTVNGLLLSTANGHP